MYVPKKNIWYNKGLFRFTSIDAKKLTLENIYIFGFHTPTKDTPMNELEQAYRDKGKNYILRIQHLNQQSHAKFVNYLILTSSPYLLQLIWVLR